jgi:hypothetical protein
MAFLFYVATAVVLLWLAHRFVSPLTLPAALLLLLLPLCFTGRALLSGGIYAPVDLPYLTEPLRQLRVPLGVPEPYNGMLGDLFAQMIPWRKAVQFALRNHQWPLWNPFILSGTVLAAAAQPAPYSPFTLIACLLPIGHSLTYSAASTLFIAGLGAFLFAREIGCRSWPALIAAGAWMYSMPMAFFLLWAVGASWAFFPFVLLATRRCVWRPSLASVALLTISLTLLLLAGHPETALHVTFVGSLYGLLELARRREQILRGIASAFSAGVLALLLSAVYVLPILEAAPQTRDYQFRRNVWSKQPHGVSTIESAARIATDLFPFMHGQWWKLGDVHGLPLDSAAVGSIVLALAVYAVLRARSAEVWFLAALAVFGILAHAGWAPLANTLQKLPLFDTTINERFSFAAAFALATLAAVSAEQLQRRGNDRAFVWVVAIAFLVITAGTTFLRSSSITSIKAFLPWGRYAFFGEIACLGLVTLAAIAPLPRRLIAPTLLGLILLQRWLEAGDIYPTLRQEAAYPPIPIFKQLKAAARPFRVVGQQHAFIPGTSALYELEDVRGYDALTFERYVATYSLWCTEQPVWFNRVHDLTRPFLSFLNVRYAIASSSSEVPSGWRIVSEEHGSHLLENENVLPRAFVPERVMVGDTPYDMLLEEMRVQKDFRGRAWIAAEMPRQEQQNGAGEVSVEQRPNGFRVYTSMKAAGWIVISQPAWKGWRAYIDGRPTDLRIANVAFLAVHLPEGNHTVRLMYLPEWFVIGRALTLATATAILFFWVGLILRRRFAAR